MNRKVLLCWLIATIAIHIEAGGSQDVGALVDQWFPDELVDRWERVSPGVDPYKINDHVLADVNGDGIQEIVAAYSNGISAIVRVVSLDGRLLDDFTEPRIFTVSVRIDAFDLDEDGKDEVRLPTTGATGSTTEDWIFSWQDDGLSVISPLNTSFNPPLSKIFTSSVMDIDADGIPELLSESTDPDDRTTEIFNMDGNALKKTGTMSAYEMFVRRSGKPVNESREFGIDNDSIEYEVRLLNGESDKSTQVTAARVLLNGEPLFAPNDFRKGERLMTRTTRLNEENTLEVTLEGQPGSFIRVYAMPVSD